MADNEDYPYKVSVSIITYNQKEYISKAIEGALKQKVNFPYEIIIGDDGSTDGTRELLVEYRDQYPDLIKLHLHDEHWEEGIPGRLNNITNIRSAKGEYIAFCDGDDYWVSEDKLQKQADFMDANPEYSFCFHNAKYHREDDSKKDFIVSEKYFQCRKDRRFTEKEIAFKQFNIASSSVFYRTKCIQQIPGWFWNIHSADYALQLIAIEQGPAYYFKDIISVQVKNSNSVTLNYYQEKGLLNLNKSDQLLYKKHLEINPSYFQDIESKKHLQNALRKYKKANYSGMIVFLTKAIIKDKKILRTIFSITVSKAYRMLRIVQVIVK